MVSDMKKLIDSGIEWIGDIPEDWDITRLGTKFTERKEKVSDVDFEPLSVTKNGVVKQLETVAKTKNNDDRKKVCIGDFVINSRSDRKQSCGLSLYNGSVSVINTVLTSKLLLPEYASRLLNNYGFAEEFYRWGSGIHADLWSTRYTDMKRISIPIPPADKQITITKYLEIKIALIDNILTKTKESIEEYKKYKQALITEAVTKGLNPNVKMKDSGIEWIGEIPEHWEVKAHKYVMYKSKEICLKYNGEDILSLTKKGVIKRDLENPSGKMPTTFDGYQIVYPQNLLLCLFDIDVTPRCVGLIKDYGLTSPAYSQFIIKSGNVPDYYNLLLETIDDVKSFLHLSKNLRSSLTETDFGAIKTIIPPFNEQKDVSAFVESNKMEIECFINKKQSLILELESYKKSLIYEVVTGKKEIKSEEV
jgi:type I restriction enzyme S subunit